MCLNVKNNCFFFYAQRLSIKIFSTLFNVMTLIIYWKIIEIPRWIIKYLSININVMIKYINHLHRLIYQKLNDWSKMTSSHKSSYTQFTQKKDTHKSWSRENRKKDVKRWKGRYTKVKKEQTNTSDWIRSYAIWKTGQTAFYSCFGSSRGDGGETRWPRTWESDSKNANVPLKTILRSNCLWWLAKLHKLSSPPNAWIFRNYNTLYKTWFSNIGFPTFASFLRRNYPMKVWIDR